MLNKLIFFHIILRENCCSCSCCWFLADPFELLNWCWLALNDDLLLLELLLLLFLQTVFNNNYYYYCYYGCCCSFSNCLLMNCYYYYYYYCCCCYYYYLRTMNTVDWGFEDVAIYWLIFTLSYIIRNTYIIYYAYYFRFNL